MIFSSITFICFFLPAVLLVYHCMPNLLAKNFVLFVASLLFYAWGEPLYIFLMLASICLNYSSGLIIASAKAAARNSKAKKALAGAVVVNLALLFVFKYLGFACVIANLFLDALNIPLLKEINLLLPIGISFYTFQEISYLVDVYRNPGLVQKSPLNLGLYVSFFPQLIAGPIVRYSDIKAQIENRYSSVDFFAKGIERFCFGLGKKVLLANQFALVCDKIYEFAPTSFVGARLAWIACFSYALQIYFDFSGYSDMAIGLSKMFGFSLGENFNYPYAANSITDFWRRWHISLSSWFKDYVYIPLGGNRKGKLRAMANRFVVFFLTGLWHGAAFNFVFWGLGHGTLMMLERIGVSSVQNAKQKYPPPSFLSVLRRALVLLETALLWVLFRNSLKGTLKIFIQMFGLYAPLEKLRGHGFLNLFPTQLIEPYVSARFVFCLFAGAALSLPVYPKIAERVNKAGQAVQKAFAVFKYLFLLCVLIMSLSSLAGGTYNPFIYFRF